MKSIPKRKILVLFNYTESVVPPRCRNFRVVTRDDGNINVSIPVLTTDEAPVALRASGRFSFRDNQSWSVEYRTWHGHLWTSLCVGRNSEPCGQTVGRDDWEWMDWPDTVDRRDAVPRGFGFENHPPKSLDFEVRHARAVASNNVIIDGKTWKKADERGYEVTTFGLGNNHGGTGLFVTSASSLRDTRERDIFNLLDRDKALAHGTEVAQERGDSKSLPMSVNSEVDWEILIPDVLRIPRRR